jgi:hypothetical protein
MIDWHADWLKLQITYAKHRTFSELGVSYCLSSFLLLMKTKLKIR